MSAPDTVQAGTTEILFYTRNLKPGELARFSLRTTASLCGEVWTQASDGVVIRSQADNEPVVLWYIHGGRFPTTPFGMGDTERAARAILEALHSWSSRGRR